MEYYKKHKASFMFIKLIYLLNECMCTCVYFYLTKAVTCLNITGKSQGFGGNIWMKGNLSSWKTLGRIKQTMNSLKNNKIREKKVAKRSF